MRLRTRWASAALLLLVPLISSAHAVAAVPGDGGVVVERSARAVPGQYIVTLEPEYSASSAMEQLGVGNGTAAGMLAGFDWVAGHAKQPAVLNASLGGPGSVAVDDAVDAIAARGTLPVVAAGNSSLDACTISPARAAHVVTVAASDAQDRQTSFSNYGPCVEMYAPGSAIVSAKLGGGSVAMSGTSMASPHVAGGAALYKQWKPAATPNDLTRWLVDQSTKNVLSSLGAGSPNRLLYTAGL